MGDGYVQFIKGNEFWELIKRSHAAFTLLSVIAQRARRINSRISNLKIGEAMIGDFKNYGMSEQNYRTAKAILEECGLVTLKPTSEGTIAKIINTSIFDINIEEGNGQINTQPTDSQRTGNGRVTTNNNVNKEKNDKKIELNISFNNFWKIYPRKTARATCLKKWLVIQPDAELAQTIIDSVPKQIETGMLNAVELRFCPLPMTWLNQKRWEDPIIEIKSKQPTETPEPEMKVF